MASDLHYSPGTPHPQCRRLGFRGTLRKSRRCKWWIICWATLKLKWVSCVYIWMNAWLLQWGYLVHSSLFGVVGCDWDVICSTSWLLQLASASFSFHPISSITKTLTPLPPSKSHMPQSTHTNYKTSWKQPTSNHEIGQTANSTTYHKKKENKHSRSIPENPHQYEHV